MNYKGKGMRAPLIGKLSSPIGTIGRAGGPLGGYKLGRKTKSRKLKQVFG